VTPAGEDLSAVAFIDAQNGWAVGSGGALLHTSDGGARWTDQTTHTKADLTCVVFTDALHGLAGGIAGSLLRTRDGGRTWTKIRLTGLGKEIVISELVFADARHGWAVADGPPWTQSVIAATDDGGAHWRPVFSRRGTWVQGLTRSRGGDLWAAAEREGDFFGFEENAVVHSTDGGASWDVKRANIWAHAVIVCGDRLLGLTGSGVAVSTDGAESWKMQSSWSYVPAQIDMTDASHGWGLAEASFRDDDVDVVRTVDGVSWTIQRAPTRRSFLGLDFVDDRRGWLVGLDPGADALRLKASVFRTVDSGGSWQQQGQGLTGLLFGVKAADDTHVWTWGIIGVLELLTGDAGVMYATSDGGATWGVQHLPKGFMPMDAAFLDADHGWACGQSFAEERGDAIIHTDDGGVHWTVQPTVDAAGTDYGFTSICFTDAQHGWAVGVGEAGDSVLLATVDGGLSWRRAGAGQPIEQDTLGTIIMRDSSRGWLLGESVWRTADGGATWARCEGIGQMQDGSIAGDVAFITDGSAVLSSADLAGDSAPPISFDDGDARWHRSNVTVRLATSEVGGGVVAGFNYRIDDDPHWQAVTGPIVFPAPPDHSGDGVHELWYGAVDSNGNVEPAYYVPVAIDTVRPRLTAVRSSPVFRGKVAKVRFRVDDISTTRVDVVVKIRHAGRSAVIKTVRARVRPKASRVLAFRCTLPAGRYRFTVFATDLAGNRQARAGHGTLIVRDP
jgi:photosystem II stability/assembly factor-like uncharacterized protein